MKEKMNLRHALSVHFRAARELNRVNRSFFPVITLYAVVKAILPYVTVFFSARILKELAVLRRPDVLRNWVIAGVLATGLCTIAKAVLYRRHKTVYADMYGRKEIIFCRKFFAMDYADMDKQETHDLRAQIAQNENWSSFGLMQVPEIYERTLKSLIGILSGIALTVTLFTSPVPESAGKLTALNNPLFILALAGGMILVSVLAGKCNEKSISYWSRATEDATMGNRLFTSFGFIGRKKGRGADIRMYNQQNLVTFYWNGDSAFGATGKIGKLALGPIGGYSALGTGVVALITGFVYVFTCLKAWGGAFDVGSVTQYVGAATAMAGSIFELTGLLGILKTNTKFLDTTFQFLDIPNAMYQGSLTTEKRSDRQYEVEFRNVSFRYPGRVDWALKNVSMKFKVGRRLAIVGENGSGKTTFIKLAAGLLTPTAGQITVCGEKIGTATKAMVSYLPDRPYFSRQVRVEQQLDFFQDFYADFDRTRAEEMLSALNISLSAKFKSLSKGNQEKVQLVLVMSRRAKLYLLDEPIGGVDPAAREYILNTILKNFDESSSILITTHLIQDVEAIFDQVLFLNQGKIVIDGEVDEIRQQHGKSIDRLFREVFKC